MSSSRKTTSNGSERFNLRLEAPLKARLTEAATKAGFATVSAHVRHILMRDADGQSTGRQLDDMEHKTIETIDRLSREVQQLRIQHRLRPRRPRQDRANDKVPVEWSA